MTPNTNAPLVGKGASVNANRPNFNTSEPNNSAIDQFRQAMQAAGIQAKSIYRAGKLKRTRRTNAQLDQLDKVGSL
jgi:hypothetical protein